MEGPEIKLVTPSRHLIGRLYAPALAQLVAAQRQPSHLLWGNRVFRWSSTHLYYVEMHTWSVTEDADNSVDEVCPSKECPACNT